MGQIYETIELDFIPTPDESAKIESFTLNYLRDSTPVRTGNLRSSWSVASEGSRVVVQNSAEYSSFVDQGTSRMRARDMTGATEQPAIEFAQQIAEAHQFLATAAAAKFEGTGDAELDARILEAATKGLGSVNTSRKQVGLFSQGHRTLKTYNDAARNGTKLLAALDSVSRNLGVSPQRNQTLADLYGFVAESYGITPQVSNFVP